MFCSKCGDPVEPNEKFCNKCGNPLNNQQSNQTTQNISNSIPNPLYNSNNYNQNIQSINTGNNQNFNYQNNNNYNNYQQNYSTKNNKKMIFIGAGVGIGVFLILFLIINFTGGSSGKYFFDTNSSEQNNEIVQNPGTQPRKSKYSTVIIYDNTYSGVKISKDTDAFALIVKDSISQKNNCPSDIKQVEDEMINKYGITAVNLCEMDVDFARELGNVFKKIYEEYPSVRGYITNLTLVNASMSDGYIAAFMPVFNFATSDSSSTYPWVIKTQVLLNTTYFLNKERLEAAATDGSSSGHFPKNSTIYSPVAHELGHYLSFLAMMKHYNLDSILLVDSNNVSTFFSLYDDFGKGNYSLTMITEAYEKYKKDTNTTISLDEWRGTISNYALAKNNSGEYIYDETIAESLHDVYLNGNNASEASKYVVAVLKEKLGS